MKERHSLPLPPLRLLCLPLLCLAALAPGQGQDSPFIQANGLPDYNLPEVADAASAAISPEEERQLGSQWLRELRNNAPLYQDPMIYHYVEDLCQRVSAAAPLTDRHINLLIIDDKAINAFAAPGNIVAVNIGLLLQASNEGQVSSVIAHEFAHLTQRHFARRLNRNNNVSQTVLVLAALLAMATGNSDVATASLFATQAAIQQSQLAHSREAEREADRLGLQYLVGAGYSPRSMVQMLDLLAQLQSGRDLPPQYLVTHPFADNRKSEVSGAIQTLPQTGRTDSLNFQMAKIRLLARSSSSATQNIAAWKQEFESTTNESRRLVLAVGLATALHRLGNHTDALSFLYRVQATPETEVALAYVTGEVLLAGRRYEQAVQRLQPLYRRRQNAALLVQIYSQAMLMAGQLQKASIAIGELRAQRPDLPRVWQLSAQIQARLGNTVNYHRFEAGYLERVGRIREAAEHISAAMELSEDDLQLYEALREQRQDLLRGGRGAS